MRVPWKRARTTPGVLVLDLGTHKALALVVCAVDGQPEVCGWAERPASTLRAESIREGSSSRSVLAGLLREAQEHAGVRARRVVAGVAGRHVRSIRARGCLRRRVPIVLRHHHVERALDAASDIGLPRDHEILHVVPTGYQVDGVHAVGDPVGMRGRSLVVEAIVVTVASAVLDHLERSLLPLGYELAGAAAEPLAAARSGLSEEDRRTGAVLIDLGGARVGGASFGHGVLRGLAWVDAGGEHVTRDLAHGLRCDLLEAERLKRKLGCALREASTDLSEEIWREGRPLLVRQELLADLIEPRMEELFVSIRDALRVQEALSVADRVVLAGGGARLRKSLELAEQVFEAPARLATPSVTRGWREAIGDPACCTAMGLVDYAFRCGLVHTVQESPWARAAHTIRRILGDAYHNDAASDLVPRGWGGGGRA